MLAWSATTAQQGSSCFIAMSLNIFLFFGLCVKFSAACRLSFVLNPLSLLFLLSGWLFDHMTASFSMLEVVQAFAPCDEILN